MMFSQHVYLLPQVTCLLHQQKRDASLVVGELFLLVDLQQILYNGSEYQQSPMLHVMLSMVVASQILCCALVIQELAAKMHVKEILVGHLFAMKEEKLSLLVL